MLERTILELICRRVEILFSDRDKKLKWSVAEVIEKIGPSGGLFSSDMLSKVSNQYKQEVRERLDLVWQGIKQVTETAGIPFSEALAEDFKAALKHHSVYMIPSVLNLWDEDIKQFRLSKNDLGENTYDRLHEDALNALKKVETDIDLYVLGLKAQSRNPTPMKQSAQSPNYGVDIKNNAVFLDTDLLSNLKAIKGARLDISKLVKMCEELNDSYERGNYISSLLLLRAITNHVPPVFGVNKFSEVVAHSNRSMKAILARLNDDARPIADLHTHLSMRTTEELPTKNQIEPYKPSFEHLIQEVIVRLRSD